MDNIVNTRLFGMLGFAMRAGKVIIGADPVCKAMAKRGKDRPRLVMVAYNASEGTKKKIFTKAEFYGIEATLIDIDSSELGRLLGKLYAPATVAIADDRFADEIRNALGTTDIHGGTN